MNDSKSIFIITSEFPPQPGGIGNHAYHLANELHVQGFKITVLTDERSKKGLEEKEFDANQPFDILRIKRYNIVFYTYLKRISTYRRLVSSQQLVLASGKFSLWLVGLDPFLKSKNKYAVIHGSELNLQGVSKKLIDRALQNFRTIIAVSHYTKSLVSSLNLKNIQVIPNGFKMAVIENLAPTKNLKNKNYPVLITVGNVSERKGQLNMIKALPELLKVYPTSLYHIVGIPTLQKTFEKEAKKLGVHKSVIFHGKVTEERKQYLLKESDIFVMLSSLTSTGDVEGFGIAIIEANVLGLPAIGSNNSGIVDAIKNNVSGKLVDPLNTMEIIEAIEDISTTYLNYSNQAKEWSQQFDWKIIIKKYLKIFE